MSKREEAAREYAHRKYPVECPEEDGMRPLSTTRVVCRRGTFLDFKAGAEWEAKNGPTFQRAIEMLRKEGPLMSFSRDSAAWADWLESKAGEA